MKEQIIETTNELKIFVNEKFEHLDCWPTRLLKAQRAIANGSNVRGQKEPSTSGGAGNRSGNSSI